MTPALAGCRTALVGTAWTISYLVSTNRLRKPLPSPCRGGISGTVSRFQWEARVFAGWRALIIEISLMSGSDQGRDPTENASKKLCLKFPVLRSSIQKYIWIKERHS